MLKNFHVGAMLLAAIAASSTAVSGASVFTGSGHAYDSQQTNAEADLKFLAAS